MMGVKTCRRQESCDLFTALLTVRNGSDNRKNLKHMNIWIHRDKWMDFVIKNRGKQSEERPSSSHFKKPPRKIDEWEYRLDGNDEIEFWS